MRSGSVIICAYTLDRWAEIKAAIESVRRQTVPPVELLLVIDYNDDLRRRAEAEIAGGIVRVVANKYGRGLSGGRETGAELATGDVIVFLDDDAVAEPEWLAQFLLAYDDPQVLGTGGTIIPNWQAGEPAWFPPEFYWVVGCTFRGMPVGPNGTLRNPIGASMSVRADVFRRLGNFSAALGRREGVATRLGVIAESCEETEFGIRATRLFPGQVWRFCPHARIHHLVPQKRASWRYFIQRCVMEGRAKAVLTTVVGGSQDSLGSERQYIRALAAGWLHAVLRGRVRRAGAILIGLAVTAGTYCHARKAAQRNIASAGGLGYSQTTGS